MKDKQPRRPSKVDAPLDKLHPSSAMGKRAKGGDKVSNPGVPGHQNDQTPGKTRKGNR